MASFVEFSIYIILYILIYLLGSTYKFSVSGWVGRQLPSIFAFWHKGMFPLLFGFRKKGIAVLVSRSRDGEIVSRILQMFGYKSVRGSTTRGGTAGLKGMVEILKSGGDVALTPDGPKGPRGEIKEGLSLLMHYGHLYCVDVRVRRYIRLNSWDRFVIPLPFSNIEIVLNELKIWDKKKAKRLLGEV